MLAGLPDLDRAELLNHWRQHYQVEPPARISKQLLIYAIAYRMQEQVMGGLKPATRRFLERVANDDCVMVDVANVAGGDNSGKGDIASITLARKKRAIPVASIIKPGTRLLREWHGVTYEVMIAEGGVLFQGKQYRSLSEVARAITGTRWSGPLFFGLRKQEAA